MRQCGVALAFAAALVLGGCVSVTPASGLTGTVLAGPTCPVERLGQPCPDRLVAVRLRAVQLTAGGRTGPTTARFASDRQGRFHVALPPGTYRIENDGGMLPRCDAQVTVPTGVVARVTVECDTGIR